MSGAEGDGLTILVLVGRRVRLALAIAALSFLAGLLAYADVFGSPPGPGRQPAPVPPPDPRYPLAGRLVALDAGHGGIDGGCSAGPWLEKDLALDVVLEVRRLLHAEEARVFLTRERDHDLSKLGRGEFRHRRDLHARVNLVRRSGAELLLSVHLNAAHSLGLRGPITFFQGASRESERLGRLVQEELLRLYPGCSERAWPNTFYLLRHSPCPTVLVEIGFLSHPEDRVRLTDPSFRRRVAAALVAALRRYAAGA